MSSIVQSKASSASKIIFDLEMILMDVYLHPLKSHHELEKLFTYLIDFSIPADLARFFAEIKALVHSKLEQGRFLNDLQCQLLMAWLTELRSQWVKHDKFQEEIDIALLTSLHDNIFELEQSPKQSLQAFIGSYEGDLEEGMHALSQLSDLGYWSIDQAGNNLHPNFYQGKLYLRITLTTDMSLAVLRSRAENWLWDKVEPTNGTSLVLPTTAENYWVDWLHLLASEREVWRSSSSFLRFYQSLQEQVNSQFSCSLDGVLEQTSKTGLRVLLPCENDMRISSFDLYCGHILYTQEHQHEKKAMPLSESVIAIYCFVSGGEAFVLPAFRVIHGLSDLASNDNSGWVYDKGEWQFVDDGGDKQSVQVRQGGECLRILFDTVERDYGVAQRCTCLPTKIQNVWRIREGFILEPTLPNNEVTPSILQRHLYEPRRLYSQVRKAISFELKPEGGIDLYSDMVIGIVPYRSITRLMSCLMYYAGNVVPLIEPESCFCHLDDMVIIVCSRGVYLAFRGRYRIDKVKSNDYADDTRFSLRQDGRDKQIRISSSGWFLLDQKHTYLLQEQLLKVME